MAQEEDISESSITSSYLSNGQAPIAEELAVVVLPTPVAAGISPFSFFFFWKIWLVVLKYGQISNFGLCLVDTCTFDPSARESSQM